MKYYLAEFRDQVFNGSLSLYKRVFFQFLILNIAVGIISFAVYTPLVLKLFSWNFSDYLGSQTKVEEFGKMLQKGGDPATAFEDVFGVLNYIYAIPLLVFMLFVCIWTLNLYYQVNDLEVRKNNRSILIAFKNSFSTQLFTILVYMILYCLLSIASFVIFMTVVSMIMQIIKLLGILIGFIGFFFLLFFLLRFTLGFAAIVHGKMNISDAFAYSYTKITFGRAAKLFLIGIVTLLVFAIASGIGSSLIHLIVNHENSSLLTNYVVNQIFGTIIGVILSTFIFTGSSALYFRYSNDEDQDDA